MFLDRLDHVRLGMPPGGAPLADWFYEEVLGLPRVPAPLTDTVRGDRWFERGAVRVHLVEDDDFVPAPVAGPTFTVSDIVSFGSRLRSAGVAFDDEHDALGPALGLTDPFGNALVFRPGRGASELPAAAASIETVATAAAGADVASLLRFALELDRLRTVERESFVAGGLRRENAAEHAWHVALTARLCAPLAGPDVDVDRALVQLLVHGVVEIDTGDTSVHGRAGEAPGTEREGRAADRLFGILPPPVGDELRAAWDEYEQAQTPTARFARSVDRLSPFLLGLAADGVPWARRGVTGADLRAVLADVGVEIQPLGPVVEALLARAVEEGVLPAGGSGLILDTSLYPDDPPG